MAGDDGWVAREGTLWRAFDDAVKRLLGFPPTRSSASQRPSLLPEFYSRHIIFKEKQCRYTIKDFLSLDCYILGNLKIIPPNQRDHQNETKQKVSKLSSVKSCVHTCSFCQLLLELATKKLQMPKGKKMLYN